MTSAEIEELLPLLAGHFEITSPTDEEYNCVAWSVNDIKQWWWPTPPGQARWPGKYWPPGIPDEETLEAFIQAYTDLGFAICDGSTRQDGYDMIAIYTDASGTVTHVARWWVEDRGWSSKLGEENDITHHSLESIEGTPYGAVARIMRRRRAR